MTKFTYKSGVGIIPNKEKKKVKIRLTKKSNCASWHNDKIGTEYHDVTELEINYLVHFTPTCGGIVNKDCAEIIE